MQLQTSDFEQSSDKSPDWDFIETLYVSSDMFAGEITRIPSIRGTVTVDQINDRAQKQGWAAKRKKIRESKLLAIGTNIQEVLQESADNVRKFLSNQIDREIEEFRRVVVKPGLFEMNKRLDTLHKIANLAEKVYPSERFGIPEDAKKGYVALTQINLNMGPRTMESLGMGNGQDVIEVNGGPANALDTPSAILPFPGNKNESTGILTQKNGIPKDEQEVFIPEKTTNPPAAKKTAIKKSSQPGQK